jgi:hypothetical protein
MLKTRFKELIKDKRLSDRRLKLEQAATSQLDVPSVLS